MLKLLVQNAMTIFYALYKVSKVTTYKYSVPFGLTVTVLIVIQNKKFKTTEEAGYTFLHLVIKIEISIFWKT